MQPNQQDPNTQPEVPQQPAPAPPQPLPYGVPEYLDLGPIADPVVVAERKKKRRRITLIVVGLLVVAVGIGLLGYWLWQQNTPQERFYRALDSQMQVKYEARKVTVASKGVGNKATLKIDSQSDFSDVKEPKTSISFLTMNGASKDAQGKLVSIGIAERYGLFSAENNPSRELKLSKDVWYKAPDKGLVFDRIFDTNRLAEQLNASVGLPITGNFDASSREKIINTLKSGQMYTVRNEKDEEQDVSVYTVAAKPDGLYKAYLEFAKEQKVTTAANGRLLSVANLSGDLKFWFNSKINRFTKLSYVIKFAQSGSTADVTLDLSYPGELKIIPPEDVQEFTLPAKASQ